jgi:hypothetical protein
MLQINKLLENLTALNPLALELIAHTGQQKTGI